MRDASETVFEMALTLFEDEVKCLGSANQTLELGESLHFCYRTFVRAACAVIEGTTHCLKDAAYSIHIQRGVELSRAQTALLMEESYKLNDNGTIYEGNSYPRLLPNIQFAFNMYARASDITFELDGKALRNYLLPAKNIRNNLMHPKKVEHLLLSEKDATIMADASIWFGRELIALFKRSNPYMESRIGDLDHQLNYLGQLKTNTA